MRMRTVSALVALIVLALSVGASTAGAAHVTGPAAVQNAGGLTFAGNAFGTYAFVGNAVTSGKSALVSLGCMTPAGDHGGGNLVGLNVPGVLTTGALNTTVATSASAGTVRSTTSADLQDANLLAGKITASEVKAVSTTTHDSAGFHLSATGSSLANLVVGGKSIPATPSPNTTIPLRGIGKVVLNEQIHKVGPTGYSFTVNMIHVYVTALPGRGTQIIVGHAASGLVPASRAASLGGGAYGSFAHVGTTVTSGRSWPVDMPCGGTSGNRATNSGAGVSIPGVVSTGTVTDTAEGTANASMGNGETTSSVQKVKLGSSLVTADLVKADAHVSLSGGTTSLGDTGSRFVNLVVNGHSISGPVPANTKISMGNITIWLHRVIKGTRSIQIRMIEITAAGPNLQGLPIGTDLVVAAAGAGALAVIPSA